MLFRSKHFEKALSQAQLGFTTLDQQGYFSDRLRMFRQTYRHQPRPWTQDELALQQEDIAFSKEVFDVVKDVIWGTSSKRYAKRDLKQRYYDTVKQYALAHSEKEKAVRWQQLEMILVVQEALTTTKQISDSEHPLNWGISSVTNNIKQLPLIARLRSHKQGIETLLSGGDTAQTLDALKPLRKVLQQTKAKTASSTTTSSSSQSQPASAPPLSPLNGVTTPKSVMKGSASTTGLGPMHGSPNVATPTTPQSGTAVGPVATPSPGATSSPGAVVPAYNPALQTSPYSTGVLQGIQERAHTFSDQVMATSSDRAQGNYIHTNMVSNMFAMFLRKLVEAKGATNDPNAALFSTHVRQTFDQLVKTIQSQQQAMKQLKKVSQLDDCFKAISASALKLTTQLTLLMVSTSDTTQQKDISDLMVKISQVNQHCYEARNEMIPKLEDFAKQEAQQAIERDRQARLDLIKAKVQEQKAAREAARQATLADTTFGSPSGHVSRQSFKHASRRRFRPEIKQGDSDPDSDDGFTPDADWRLDDVSDVGDTPRTPSSRDTTGGFERQTRASFLSRHRMQTSKNSQSHRGSVAK